MQDFKSRYEKLLTDAADCELIGGLAVDQTKRASFRRLAEQLHDIAAQLKADMDGGAAPEQPISDREFLLRHAKECRDLAAASDEAKIRADPIRMAEEFEQKVVQEH